MKRALYFGCRGAREPGHYLQEGRKTIWDCPPEISFWDRLMDGGLLKNGKRPDVDDGNVRDRRCARHLPSLCRNHG